MAGATSEAAARRVNRWRITLWGAAALVLLIPLVAMQLTAGVSWTASDFAFLAVLMGGLVAGCELAIRRTGDVAYRAAAIVALVTAILLILINGAVGVIGSEREDANFLFGGVVAVALLGAVMARFQPAGMARAMAVAALAQALVPAIASVVAPEVRVLAWSPQVLWLTGVFVALWLASAWLFGKAASRPSSRGPAAR
jgi:hypothetical protein